MTTTPKGGMKERNMMDEEIKSLTIRETYEQAKLPPDSKVIGGKWLYTFKGPSDAPTYKARYVAQGFSQIPGVDFDETFAPTPRMESLRMFIQIAAHYDLSLHQMDVKCAFLHADLDEEIYIRAPKGYEQPGFVWKLRKSLYGLKQSGRNWFSLLESYLHEHSFGNIDSCIFVKRLTDGRELIMILIWVDDIVIASSSDGLLNIIKKQLKERFVMKDLGELSYFLGIEFTRTETTIEMKQTRYLETVLQRLGMENCKPRANPCETNLRVYESEEPYDTHSYREAVGSLVYAMVTTRPDLCFVVSKLSQKLANPTTGDWQMLKHVMQYVKGTTDLGLRFKRTPNLKLIGYADADWASAADRRSTTGYCFLMTEDGPAISWKTKRQASTALSTCEAEYMALSAATQEAIYLARIFTSFMNIESEVTVKMFCDNQGAIALTKNPKNHGRSKHIDIRYHFVRDCLLNNQIELKYIPSNDNLADPFTKTLGRVKWSNLKDSLFGI